VGKARIGFAISDVHGILAAPIATLSRSDYEANPDILFTFVEDFQDLLEIYIGLPLNLQGRSTASTEDAVEFAQALGAITNVPIRLVDERMTTAISNQQIRELGKSQKEARSTIDQMAAVAILEYAFQIERNSTKVPGLSLEEWRSQND
jgi:putative Holliday junction resolvase